MIIGLNEDVVYKGVPFHIQTEDRGRQKALLVSTLFYKGMILLEERTDYSHLLQEPDLDKKVRLLKSELHERVKRNLQEGLYDERIRNYFKGLKKQKAATSKKEEDDKYRSGLERLFEEVILPSIKSDLGIVLKEETVKEIKNKINDISTRTEKDAFLSLCAILYEQVKDRCSKEEFKRVAKTWLGRKKDEPSPLRYRDDFKNMLESIVYKDLEKAIGASLTRALIDKVVDEIHPMFFKKPEAFDIIITRILNSGIIQKKTEPSWRNSVEPLWKQRYQGIVLTSRQNV